MKIFLSWSGERGKQVAEALRVWLVDVCHHLLPWVSFEDIEKGARWDTEIAENLRDTNFGIVCLTPENLKAPWLLFEAGALSKSLDASRVCTYLLGLKPSDIESPLSRFQATVATK